MKRSRDFSRDTFFAIRDEVDCLSAFTKWDVELFLTGDVNVYRSIANKNIGTGGMLSAISCWPPSEANTRWKPNDEN